MIKKIIYISIAMICIASANAKPSLRPVKKIKILREGFVISQTDGRIIEDKKKKIWLFEFDSQIKDDRFTLKKGTPLQLLPSASLEKIIDNLKQNKNNKFRIWAKVTSFEEKNYLFPTYFLPIKQKIITTPNESKVPKVRNNTPTFNNPKDSVTLPEEVRNKFTSKNKIVRTQLPKNFLPKTPDKILINRTGFITKQKNGTFVFAFDALGQKIQKRSYKILPCSSLDQIDEKQFEELEKIRYKISGRVTVFQKNKFILLKKATRSYSHGNFPR